jgi:hypothetical protein
VIQAFQVVFYGRPTTVRLEEIKNLKFDELIIMADGVPISGNEVQTAQDRVPLLLSASPPVVRKKTFQSPFSSLK